MLTSNILSNNATSLAVSGQGEENYDFQTRLDFVTAKKLPKSGTVTESRKLKRSDIVSMMVQDYRSHFTAIYGKKQNIPAEKHKLICEVVDKYLEAKLGQIGLHNLTTFDRKSKFNVRTGEVVELLTAKGENLLLLKDQHARWTIYQGDVKRRMEDSEKKGTLTDDREKAMKGKLMDIELALLKNEMLQKEQEKLASDANKAAINS